MCENENSGEISPAGVCVCYSAVRFLEIESPGNLYETWVIGLSTHDAEVRVADRLAGETELNTIEEIEELSAEGEFIPAVRSKGKALYRREVPVCNARCAQLWIDARLVAERERIGLRKATGIKPLVES